MSKFEIQTALHSKEGPKIILDHVSIPKLFLCLAKVVRPDPSSTHKIVGCGHKDLFRRAQLKKKFAYVV